MDKVEKTISDYQDYIRNITEEIVEGVSQGVREGVANGLKRGAKTALEDCLTKGFVNIGQEDIEDIQDILQDIPGAIVKNAAKEGSKHIFDEVSKKYIQRLCQEIIDEIRNQDVRLSEDQAEGILDFIKSRGLETVSGMTERLPDNSLLRKAVAGTQEALEEGLDRDLTACRGRIIKEIRILERGGRGNVTGE